MKSLKIIISLSLLMFYVSIINVDAKENLNEVYGGEYVLTDEEILENEQIALEFAKINIEIIKQEWMKLLKIGLKMVLVFQMSLQRD